MNRYSKTTTSVLIILLACIQVSWGSILTKSARVGTLQEVTKDYYVVKKKNGKTVKVKPFLSHPKVGSQIHYPDQRNLIVNKHKWIKLTKTLLKDKKQRGAVLDKYIETLAKAQAAGDMKVETPKDGEYTFLNFFLRKAYSADTPADCGDNKTCFFGGWPSKMYGRFCQPPWKHKTDQTLNRLNIGQSYNEKAKCGDSKLFRCNPAVFGTAPADPPSNVAGVNWEKSASGNKGLCVEIPKNDYKQVTVTCIKAARSIPGHQERLAAQYDAYAPFMDTIVNKVQCFCRASQAAYCLELEKFILNKEPDTPSTPNNPNTTDSPGDVEVSACEFVGEAVFNKRYKKGLPCYAGETCVSRVKCTTGAKTDDSILAVCSCGTTDADECLKQAELNIDESGKEVQPEKGAVDNN